MSAAGAGFSFGVVILIGGPLCLLLLSSTPTGTQLYVARTGKTLLGAFFAIYPFAVVSSIVFAAIGEAITVATTNYRVRWALLWMLSLLYVVGTGAFLVIGAPWIIRWYASILDNAPPVADALGYTWMVFFFSMPLHFFIVLIGYGVAAFFAPRHDAYVYNNGELFGRGLLIGLNAGMNLFLAFTAVGTFLSPMIGALSIYVGLAAGIVLATINLVTAGMPTGNQNANNAIKRIVGWTSWLMPTGWIVTVLGWVLYVISALFSVLLGWTPFYGLYLINAMLVEWPYGTLFIEGGIASNLWLQSPITSRGAYNLGLFSFFHGATVAETEPIGGTRTAVGLGATLIFGGNTRKHESGHNLNLTALGSFFHLIGAVDENVPAVARQANAYAERLADSNVPGPLGSSTVTTNNPNPPRPLPFWTF